MSKIDLNMESGGEQPLFESVREAVSEDGFIVDDEDSSQIPERDGESDGPESRMNDAIVLGDLQSPEARAVLDSRLLAGFSDRAPKVAGDQWNLVDMEWRDVLPYLTMHPVQACKEGSAIFFNETTPTGKVETRNGQRLVKIWRGKKFAKSVTAFVIDIDGTDSIDRVVEELRKRGLFAIVYTTHSHARKAH